MCSSINPSAWTFDGATTLAAGENGDGTYGHEVGQKCSFLSKKAGEFMMKDGESGSYFIQPVCFLEIKRTERRFGVSIVDL